MFCQEQKTACPATVRQEGLLFVRGPHTHTHPNQPDAEISARISHIVKETARAKRFESASSVAETILKDALSGSPCEALPKLDRLARNANYHRQKNRPHDPNDLDFILDNSHVPESFLRKDIMVSGRRHLILATDPQLELLSSAKTCYMDGPLKVVRKPFNQMFSIHAFVR